MLGLGGYASSEEEEEDKLNVPDAQVRQKPGKDSISKDDVRAVESQTYASDRTEEVEQLAPAPGPAMPTEGFEDVTYDSDEPMQELSYEEAREAIRNLTMPPAPSFDIPPSPPGSPPPQSTKKFANFLKLKKQGIHFNERLASTPALQNPTLFEKLKQHAGISEEEQYATTLPEHLAVPTSFPSWAYADELNKSQIKIRQKRETEVRRKGRDHVDFVPASGSGASSRTSTPRGLGQSAAERVLSGLDAKSAQAQARKK